MVSCEPPSVFAASAALILSAGVLIWQGSVRTKKTISVEQKLRDALQLPLAIAVPRTQDGTVITGHNKAPLPESSDGTDTNPEVQGKPDDETDESGKGDDERSETGNGDSVPLSPRRTTVTIGSTGEKLEPERPRAETVHAPGHQPPSLGPVVKQGPAHFITEAPEERK